MRMSHSEYHPIPMSAHQVLQSYALLRTMRFDAHTYTLNVNLNGFTVSTQVPKCAIVTVLIVITSVVMSGHLKGRDPGIFPTSSTSALVFMIAVLVPNTCQHWYSCRSSSPKLSPKVKFPDWKQAHLRMESSKTSQTRWEWHQNNFILSFIVHLYGSPSNKAIPYFFWRHTGKSRD